jgi:hypothetical protein
LDEKGLQEMFDRLMTMVGKIRGYGCDELDDHKVVKIMLEAYSPRNETIVTLIRDKKKFEYFTLNNVLGRILTFDMQREEGNERKMLGELQEKLEGIKINKDVALKANKSSRQGSTSKSKTNKQASTSKLKATKQVQERVETTSSSSESEHDDDQYEKVDDFALFMKRFHTGLKKQGYKVVKRKFSNKKRTCYNCGSTDHFIAKCPYEIKDNKYKKEGKEDKADHRKSKRNMGEAHIGHEWDSTIESSSEEDEKVVTVAIYKPSSPPRLFTNMSDDDYYSPHIYLMAKGKKVKSKAKAPPPPPPSDISSSDIIALVIINLVIKKLIK